MKWENVLLFLAFCLKKNFFDFTHSNKSLVFNFINDSHVEHELLIKFTLLTCFIHLNLDSCLKIYYHKKLVFFVILEKFLSKKEKNNNEITVTLCLLLKILIVVFWSLNCLIAKSKVNGQLKKIVIYFFTL